MKIAVITPIKHLEGVVELIESKGEVFLLEEGSRSEVKELLEIEDIDVIVCNPNQQSYKIDENLLKNSRVSLINTCSTGLNHIDVAYCTKRDIEIQSLTRDFALLDQLTSTAELAFGLMLDLMRSITVSNNRTREELSWNYLPFIGQQLKDYSVGIIGHGRLGKMMEKYCRAFEANVFIYDPYVKTANVKSIEELFDKSDVISIHTHVSDETKYMVNYSMLGRRVKYLINTSRGEIVNEHDVVRALKEGLLLGYGADVIEDEFGDIRMSPFFQPENAGLNCVITPHTGGMTIQGQTKAFKWSVNKIPKSNNLVRER